MEGKPLVSVIIPVLNRATLVGKTLESVVKQTYRPLEVIVVDNGSTDNTLETIEKWASSLKDDPSFKIIVSQEPHRGASHARNMDLV